MLLNSSFKTFTPATCFEERYIRRASCMASSLRSWTVKMMPFPFFQGVYFVSGRLRHVTPRFSFPGIPASSTRPLSSESIIFIAEILLILQEYQHAIADSAVKPADSNANLRSFHQSRREISRHFMARPDLFT